VAQAGLALVENAISRSGSRTGSPRSMKASTTAKVAVTAPMPTASDNTATQVNPALRRISRTA
jgi:hypothetical protein